MSENKILEQYAAQTTIIESTATDKVRQVFSTINSTMAFENKYYKMQVYYDDNGLIQMIYVNVGIAETLLASNLKDYISFDYAVSEESDLGQRGVEFLHVSSDCEKSTDLQQFCNNHPVKGNPKLGKKIIDFIRRPKGQNESELGISTDLSSNEVYLCEQGLYDELSHTIALFRALSEVCLGNSLSKEQLMGIMEVGNPFINQADREDVAAQTVEMQKELETGEKQDEVADELIKEIGEALKDEYQKMKREQIGGEQMQ